MNIIEELRKKMNDESDKVLSYINQKTEDETANYNFYLGRWSAFKDLLKELEKGESK